MAESHSDDYTKNGQEDEDYDSSSKRQSNKKHTSLSNEKYDDPAILSCGTAQMGNRIRYDREQLLKLRNAPLSRKRPEYVLEGLSMRKLWCRTTDLMAGGDERGLGRSANSNNHEYRSGASGNSNTSTTSAATYLMPLFAVKRRPNETKSIRKPDGHETGSSTTSNNTGGAPLRRSVFMSGPQLTGVGGGNSTLHDRRIGSGRIPARDAPWEFRSEKEPIDQEISFRPTGGLINLRDRNLGSEMQPKLQLQPQQQSSHRGNPLDRDRDRDRDYRDDRYDKRSYSRDYDRDKDRNGRSMGSNSNNNLGNMRFSSGSHNSERRRMFSENRSEEPEWFSGGPTSQNDTIELRGFDEPEPDEPTSRTSSTADNDDEVSIDNRSDNSNNNVDDTDVTVGVEQESTNVEDLSTSPPTNPVVEQNDTNNNDNNNPIKELTETSNNSTDDFNFEDFLKMGLMTDLCQTDEEFKETGGSESRFYRWFQRGSPTRENKSRRSSLQDDIIEGNQNNASARSAEKYFAPISPAASTGSSNSLLEFIQLGKFDKPHKEESNIAGSGRLNVQQNSVPNSVPVGLCSVEELEARMRTAGAKSQQESKNQQHQQDMQAFKKLLSQMSGTDAGMQQHREQQQQQQQQATGLMQMLSKNTQQPPFMLTNQQHQRPQNLQPPQQPPIQRQQPIDAMQNVLQIGQHLHQSRDEILKRPEAQMLIQSICNAEVTQNSLMQQLNNPASGTRHRETILAVLNFISECASRVPSPILMSSVMQSQQLSAGVPLLHGQPGGAMPLSKPPTIQTNPPPNICPNEPPNDIMQSHLLYQHHQAAAVAAAQKQLRVSPLPNGIPQRIPSPRELQFHTQSIMQSALIKKKLEEQRENFRKRQEMQQQQQQQQQTSSSSSSHLSQSDGNLLTNTSNTQTSSSSCASPAKQHQHIASPTPLAFTPTSVLRKMTAEKDMDVMNGVGMGVANKELKSSLGQQIQQQIHQQQQQQQNRQQQILFNQQQQREQQQQQQQQHQQTNQQHQQTNQQMRAQQIKWNQFNQAAQAKPIGRPIVKGGGLPMQMASNVEFQQMREQYMRKQQLPMGMNNSAQASSTLGGVQSSQQQQLNQTQSSQQLPNLSQQQQQQMAQLLQHRQQQQRAAAMRTYQTQYQQMVHHPHSSQLAQQQKPSGSSQGGNVLVNENHGMINFGREGGLSPTSNQLARWFSPELLAQASAGKLPSLNIGQALSLEEFERSIQHSSATVHN